MDPTVIGGLAPAKRVSSHTVPGTKSTPFAKLPRVERLRANNALEDPPEMNEADELDEDEMDDGQGGTKEEKAERMRMRGRGKTLKRFLRKKKKNVIDPATVAIKEKLKAERERKERARDPTKGGADETGALARFGRRHD